MDKTIITVVGKDTVGIIAKVCNYLASNNININDIINNKIVSNFCIFAHTQVLFS